MASNVPLFNNLNERKKHPSSVSQINPNQNSTSIHLELSAIKENNYLSRFLREKASV